MQQFSSKTKFILAASGWYEGRKIDASPYVDRLEAKGYRVFPIAREFFEQFGDLILHKSRPIEPRRSSMLRQIFELLRSQLKHPNPNPWLDLRGEQTLRHFTLWEPQDFIEELNTPMCPIGHCSDGIIYTIDAEGNVYGLYWSTVLFIGESGENAIERYCTWTSSNPYQVIRDES
jgi:hypothetical protein